MNNWFEVQKLDETTFVICEHGHWEKMNSYVLVGQNKALVIDSGLGIGKIKPVVEAITMLPIVAVATHVHWDHIGGHGEFEDICVHENEKEWLEKGIPIPLHVIRAQVVKEPFIIDPPKDFDIESYNVYRGTPTRILADNDRIDLGDRIIRVIHTPGHSPGHMCFYDERHGYLFSGDLIYEGMLYANYPSTSPVEFLYSVLKISQLKNLVRIFPAHNKVNIQISVIEDTLSLLDSIQSNDQLKHGSGNFHYKNIGIAL